jgi:hypothetical protein
MIRPELGDSWCWDWEAQHQERSFCWGANAWPVGSRYPVTREDVIGGRFNKED